MKMEYQYIAYREGGEMVKGRVAAITEEAALSMLDYAGYRVVNLKTFIPMFSLEKIRLRFAKIKPAEIILFYRQLALLLESGMDIVTAFEILRIQTTSYLWKKIFREIIADLRAGNPLSKALDKHPTVFSPLARQSLRVGEQAGGMESILRQMADHMQRESTTSKSIKSALTYPIIAVIATIIVVGVLVGFVLPAFGKLYASLGTELPALTRFLIDSSTALQKYMLPITGVIVAIVLGAAAYIRTPGGKFKFDTLALKLPVFGRIMQLKELSRCCRSISLLFRAGLPLTEIMPLTISSASNKAMVKALSDVQDSMLKGEGLSKPMARNDLFLPMMVQMVKVGEETGNLDVTLTAVAESYETEAKDKTDSMIAMIQPNMTIAIGGVIGLIALSMVSAMYSIYGKAF